MPTTSDDTQEIAKNLNQLDHQVTPEDVVPTTAETPIQKTEDLIKAGAEAIGEDLEYDVKDLGYMAEADLKHGDKTRTTESKNPLKLLVRKLMRKKNQNQDLVEK
ncbi:MAG: hypothetical protein Q7R49_06665 [Candidatus Daviesbacteria bacterium]|nr:hypothetical protein [Candidatus Daviesbacteria bacterium]